MTTTPAKELSKSDSVRDCPVCGNSSASFFCEKNGYPFVKCGECDLVYLESELQQDDLIPLYSEMGAPENQLRYPYNKVKHRRKRAKIRALRLRKYFKNKDVIDFGCGGGYMVDAMMKTGAARAVGIDLDPEAIAFAKENHHPDAEYFCETIEDFLSRDQKFDFGHSSQVIEHVGDFNSFVSGWADLIKPGGTLFLKTPDRNHWRTGMIPETWPDAPHYTQYFSRKNIKILLEKHGFEVNKIHFNLKPAMEIVARRKA